MITFNAVYANGVFVPQAKMELAEGAAVRLTISGEDNRLPSAPDDSSPAMREWDRRLLEARTDEEWWQVFGECPEPDDDPDFDIMAAINESRRLTGFRMPDPEPGRHRSSAAGRSCRVRGSRRHS